MFKLTSQTRRRRRADPGPKVLGRLEASAEAFRAVASILAVVTPLALVGVNFMTSRYLAAFGQPGLASLGDVSSYLTAILPVVLPVMALIAGFAALPVLPRWVAAGGQEHAFIGAFGWLERGRPDKWRGLGLYGVTHASALVAAGLLVLVFFWPATFADSRWSPLLWWIPLVLGAVILYGALRSPAKSEKAGVQRGFQTIVIFLYANFVLISWLVVLTRVAQAVLTSQLSGLSPGAGAGVATLIVLALLLLHLLASAARWEAATVIVVVTSLAMLAAPGDRAITALALRYAKLGGGLPMTYRPAGKDSPVQACLVLATGDSRIVWAPEREKRKPNDKPNDQAKGSPCEWTEFRDRLADRATTADAGGVGTALDVRVFKREDLYDKP